MATNPKKRTAPPSTKKAKAPSELGNLIDVVEKRMGQGAMVKGSSVPAFTHIPMGCFLLNLATLGGFQEGCGHMVYGNANCGKTTLLLQAVASAQRKHPEGMAVWVDVEKKFDKQWAEKHGVDLDRIYIVKPGSGEQAVDVIEGAARSLETCIIVLDSIPSLAPIKIIERSAEDMTVGERARLVGLLCSKLQQAWIDEGMRGHRFTFFAINQFREKIGVMFGDTRTLPGGRFQDYLMDSKLELKCKEVMGKDSNEFQNHEANDHSFKFTKSKGGFSIKEGQFRMVMDDSSREDNLATGSYDDFKTVATYAKKRGIISGGGASWRIRGLPKEDGTAFGKLDEILDFLKTHPEEDRLLRCALIVAQRRESRLQDLPPDGYLLGWVSEEDMDSINVVLGGDAENEEKG